MKKKKLILITLIITIICAYPISLCAKYIITKHKEVTIYIEVQPENNQIDLEQKNND